jgi:3-hydroxybutyryl-CoA dehydratase
MNGGRAMSYEQRILKWDQLEVGNSASFTKTMTETDVIMWVGLTGDLNPIHIDKEYSKTTRFGDVLVPGVLVLGLISNVITQVTFGNVYANQSIKFLKPVYIGDTITATATIIEKIEAKSMVKLETKCVNQKNELVMIGEGMEYILR